MKSPLLIAVMLLVLLRTVALAQTSTLHDVAVTGPRSTRLNIVFLSDGYTAAQLPQFALDVQRMTDYLFAREPWSRYRSFCNVYRIAVASNQSGTDYGSDGVLRDTYFNSGFASPEVGQLLYLNSTGESRVYARLNQHVSEYHIPIVLVNDSDYGGSGGPIAVTSINELGEEVLEHELGHTFANLADEYAIQYSGYTPIERPNATKQTQRASIRWTSWIDTSIPVPTPFPQTLEELNLYGPAVGLFEGANYRVNDWYRPHYQSLMQVLGIESATLGQVNREAYVLNIHEEVNAYDTRNPAATTLTITQRQNLDFSFTLKTPAIGAPLQVQWKIDATPLPTATSTNLSIPSQDIGEGTHTLVAEITDSTDWIRRDPTDLRISKLTWTLKLSNQSEPPVIDTPPAHQLHHIGASTTLTVQATPTGPAPLTYQWYKDGKAIKAATSSSLALPSLRLIDAGTYKMRVTGGSAHIECSADVTVYDDTIQTLVAQEGKTTNLTPFVSGPVQDWEWSLNTILIPPNTLGIAGLDTSRLTLSPISLTTHRGTYRLHITTAGGEVSFDTHFLDIFNNKPLWTASPGDSLPPGQVAAPYSELSPLSAAVGRPATSYSATGLPPGLRVDSKTGTLSGRPTTVKKDRFGQPIPYSLTLTAANALGRSTIPLTLLILPLPLQTVGTWTGAIPRHGDLVTPGLNNGLGGRLDLTTTASGTLSGSLTLGTTRHPFRSALLHSNDTTTSVTASILVSRGRTRTPVTFSLTLNAGQLTGQLTADATTITVNGWHNPWSTTAPADPLDGYHTFRLDFATPPPQAPEGIAHGSLTITPDGKTTITGRSPDGTAFTCKAHTSTTGQVLLYATQKGTPPGSIRGQFTIDTKANTDDLDNLLIPAPSTTLDWYRALTTSAKERLYPAGFTPQPLNIHGARYTPPSAPKVALGLDPAPAAARLTFTGASLTAATRLPTTDIDLLPLSIAKPTAPLLAKTTLSINAKLGTFTGTFDLLDPNPRAIAPLQVPRRATYHGILHHDGTHLIGSGLFTLPDLPSSLFLDSPSTTPLRTGPVTLTPLP